MADLDLAIVNGTVVTASDVARCDIGIKDGRVVLIGMGLGNSAANTIDATGKLVLPGGVDAHCHLDQESPSGLRHADDFYSGSRAAAGGGTTTIIPFANQKKRTPLRTIVNEYHDRAKNKAIIDYAFHLIISDPSEQSVGQELPALIREGYTSFKVFMTYDALRLTDGQILNLLAMARREGALVMVHAENHDCIVWLTEQLLAAGHTKPRYHTEAHPAVGEREATHRAIALAEIAAAPVLIVHVSAQQAMREIQHAQSRGLQVLAETCPQYLVLDSTRLDCHGFEGAKYICSPPPRDVADQEALWRGLATGVFQVFSSDHAPYRYADSGGKMKHGENAPFPHIANGIPGLETRLPLLFSYGVQKGRIDVNQFVAVTATNPAKIYGLYPQKGTLAIGSDADVAIWDPDKEVRITHTLLHDNMDYTPYEGMTVRGWPVTTISRGEIVSTDGEVVTAAGRGRFLPCKHPIVGAGGEARRAQN